MSIYDPPSPSDIPNDHMIADDKTRRHHQAEDDSFDKMVDKIAYAAGGGPSQAISPHPATYPDDLVDVPEFAALSLEGAPSGQQQKIVLPSVPPTPSFSQKVVDGIPRLRENFTPEKKKGKKNEQKTDTFQRTMLILGVVLLTLIVLCLFIMMFLSYRPV